MGASVSVTDYHLKHEGETCLIVGLGPNLDDTPPELFDYPSFSVNTIFKREGWKPTYYVGVDQRLWDENEEDIKEKLSDVPVFIPSPDYDYIEGENFVRFHNRGGQIAIGGWLPNHPAALTSRGIAYNRIMGAVMQIAFYMGFTRLLFIGVQHDPEDPTRHFWGDDTGSVVDQPAGHWFDEYRHWSHCGLGEVLNISPNTYVPQDVIPRDDWRKYTNG